MKLLYWDRTGYAIWYKRLEKGKFKLPTTAAASVEISGADFSILLNGFDLAKLQRQKGWSPAGTSS